jgi:hypothetical protein
MLKPWVYLIVVSQCLYKAEQRFKSFSKASKGFFEEASYIGKREKRRRVSSSKTESFGLISKSVF